MTKKLTGKELWMKIFNTDFEEAALANLKLKKDFDDDGTDKENKEIVKKLEGHTLQDVVDWYLDYYGHGMHASDIKDMVEMLQIEDIEEIKEWE
jgi:hypothetical protein